MTTTQKIISFDIGIKNMAYCIFSWVDLKPIVHQWDILNLMPDEEQKPMSVCDQCSKKATFQKNEQSFCNKHAKTSSFFVPSSPPPSFSKMKKEDLEKWVEEKIAVLPAPLKNKLLGQKPETKTALLEWIKQNTLTQCRTRKKTQEIGLVEIGRKMNESLSQQVHLEGITHVLIENQISPIATRMKTIQGMLTQYFIIRLPDVPIEFISSHNKLKVFSSLGEPSNITQSYVENKKQTVDGVIQEVFPYLSVEQQTFFLRHKKKDDLADCLLQGLWFVKMKK